MTESVVKHSGSLITTVSFYSLLPKNVLDVVLVVVVVVVVVDVVVLVVFKVVVVISLGP